MQTLELDKHILASFLINLNIEHVHSYVHVENLQQQILNMISQQDIVTNLKISLETYMNQNHVSGSKVFIFK